MNANKIIKDTIETPIGCFINRSTTMKTIKIRYNNNFPTKSQYEWRVLVDDVEHFVNSVRIEKPCYTTSEFIEGHGLVSHITTEGTFFEVVALSSTNKVAYIK